MHKKKTLLLLSLLIFIFQAGFPLKIFAEDCPSNSSFDDLSQSCKCLAGYISENSQCVKPNQYCLDSFGSNSKYNFTTGKCECSYGYIAYSGQCINANGYCQDDMGPHSLYDFSAKSCKCENNYLKNSSGYCTSVISFCADSYGDNSKYNKTTQSCECNSGYILSDGLCVNADKYCQAKQGSNSSYNFLDKNCECDSGYKLNNSKCSAIEILSISPSSASIGDKVVIQGNNLGDNNSGQKIYIGADIINISDVSNWNDNEIDLKIGSYVKGGNIVLRTYDGKVISGPNLTILAKNSDASSGGGTSGDSGKITLNQQINIAGASTDASAVKNGTTSNASTTSVAVANTQSSGGVISSVSSFFGSLFDGFKNFFSAIFS